MWVEDYQWHYDYVRLAWDTGFSFEKCKSPNLDKNKICVVDVDRIVKERDVASVDRYISTVVQYILDEEQAKVLDTNFVKIFRLSQLAVEYLLFCKKYLDNTVVLLKKELTKNREENKELKAFTDDLQAHIETLTRQQMFATFKCSLCPKVFSSEEYLNAHNQRRHQNAETYNSETDKLNTEIKELKERLNNTEKLLKEKNECTPEKKILEVSQDNSKMTEILDKFEKFKNQVDDELKELKIQKTFYEENYGKLFDIVIQNKENIEPKNQIKDILKTETTTQTEKLLQIENVQHKNVVEVQELEKNDAVQTKEISSPQKKKESLEARISTTLAGIEGQMQAFCNKLNAIEQNKAYDNNNIPDEVEDDFAAIKEVKPRAKPRSKLSQPTHNTNKFNNDAEKLKKAIEELEHQQKGGHHEVLVIQSRGNEEKKPVSQSLSRTNHVEESQSDDKSDSESESSETESISKESLQQIDKKVLLSTAESTPEKLVNKRTSEYISNALPKKDKVIAKRSAASADKRLQPRAKKTNSKKTIVNLNKEIEATLSNRLQELGISETWTRLPQRSFVKALEIINHQAELTKKAYANFNSIKKKISADIEKQLEIPSKSQKIEKVQNIVKVSYRPKSGRKISNPSPKKDPIQIKNRSLYDTDTESERNFKRSRRQTITALNATDDVQQLYPKVIEELRSLSIVKSETDEDSLDEMKDAQKGVLKSFPSIGSLSKKKVLFDLESESSKIEDAPVVQKGGGSTTSIASSILGDKVNATKEEGNDKEKLNTKNVEKDFDDLSDFDISDL